MKVLFLNNFYYLRGGSERVLFDEMRMLQEEGHETAVFTRAYPKNQSVRYERFFPDEIQRDKFSVSLKGIRTVREMIYSRQARQGLQYLLREFKPDLVHAHNIYGGLSTSVLDALKEKNIPTVMTLHDLKLFCPSYLMLNHGRICERCKGSRFYQAVITKCHKNSYVASAVYASESYVSHLFRKYDMIRRFIAPSMFLREKAIAYGWNGDKIEYIPNFIDTRLISTSNVNRGYSLYLGRLSREKGARTLLSALQDLRVKTNLIIAGDGPDRQAIQKMAAEKQLPVVFVGYLQGKELENILSGAKVIIMPSEWYENAPLSLLEAFAWGKPVIGSRIGGIPEMIEDGINGYLFEPANADDLREKWTTFLNLPAEKADAMGRSARQKVELAYTAEAHYEKLIKVYEKAMG
jgi:glycosyltransferase involved in cell wall biosynthesis